MMPIFASLCAFFATCASFFAPPKERKEEAESANKFFVRAGRNCVRETPGLMKRQLYENGINHYNKLLHVSEVW